MTVRTDCRRSRRSRSRCERASAGIRSPEQEVPGRLLQRLSLAHVSSRAGDRVAPVPAPGDPRDILRGLERVVASRPRTEILTATDDYLHAVCRTRLGLRDDLEFHFFPSEGVAGRLVLGYGLTVAQGGTLRVLDRPGSVQSRICGTDKTTAPAVCPAVIRGRDRHVTRILHG